MVISFYYILIIQLLVLLFYICFIVTGELGWLFLIFVLYEFILMFWLSGLVSGFLYLSLGTLFTWVMWVSILLVFVVFISLPFPLVLGVSGFECFIILFVVEGILIVVF